MSRFDTLGNVSSEIVLTEFVLFVFILVLCRLTMVFLGVGRGGVGGEWGTNSLR